MSIDISINDIEDFVNGKMWRTIITEVMKKFDEGQTALNIIDPIKEPSIILRTQGFNECLNWIVDLPVTIKQQIEYETRKESSDVARRDE